MRSRLSLNTNLATVSLLSLLSCLVFSACSPTPVANQPTPESTVASTSVLPVQPTSPPTQAPIPTMPPAPTEAPRTDGAASPEEAVLAFYSAIEANDANAYLDVIDPRLRSSTDNYFAQSQFLSALTQVFGLGGTLGKDASKVSFRDLTTQISEESENVARVSIVGTVRSLAFATEQPMFDSHLVRQIGGRWFVSAPTAEEVQLVQQATAEALAQEERIQKELRDQQAQILFDAILEKGEFVQNMRCPGWASYNLAALQPGNTWTPLPSLTEIASQSNTVTGERSQANFLRLSPDQSQVAIIGTATAGSGMVEVMGIDGSRRRPIISFEETGQFGDARSVEWAPDNQQVVVVGTPYQQEGVFIIDLTSDQSETVWKGVAQYALFSPDGNTIFIAIQDKNIIIQYDPDTGEEKNIAEFTGYINSMAFSPDGSQLAFTTDEGLWSVNTDGASPTKLADIRGATQPRWSPDGTIIVFQNGSGLFGVMPADASQAPIFISLPEGCGVSGAGWWVAGQTELVQADLAGQPSAGEARTIDINLTQQVLGMEGTYIKLEATEENFRVQVSIKNTGQAGRMFTRDTFAVYNIQTQRNLEQGLNQGSSNAFEFTIEPDMPSTIPVDRIWEGWLVSNQPLPPDAAGLTIRMGSFEFEEPVRDAYGNTLIQWDTSQATEGPKYISLNGSAPSEPSSSTTSQSSSSNPQEGMKVVLVAPSSPAEQAGMREGMLLLRFEAQVINSIEDALGVIAQRRGQQMEAVVIDGNQQRTLVINVPQDGPIGIDLCRLDACP